ncbi:MAG: hypothetical protein HYV33_00920 [Candidatus Kerfeldbacteria bacterium]|nr:hypothetical protein [Candidatus Kerfeldbacteria bacterium]
MADDKRYQADLTHDKQQAKQQSAETAASLSIPRWLKTLTAPQTSALIHTLEQLLDHLPTVLQSHDATIRLNYYKKIAAELTKIYYVRMRIIELSDTMPERDKPQQLDAMQQELKNRLLEVAGMIDAYA